MNQLTPLKRGEGRLEIKLTKTKRWPIFREGEHNRDTMEKTSHSKVEDQETQHLALWP